MQPEREQLCNGCAALQQQRVQLRQHALRFGRQESRSERQGGFLLDYLQQWLQVEWKYVDRLDHGELQRKPTVLDHGRIGNPFFASGTTIAQSASLVTVPLFDGHDIASGGASVTVVGYLQLFIQEIKHQGKDDWISTIVLNASSCGTQGGNACGTTGGGNTGGGGTVGGGGASFIPVRLVQHP